MRVPAIAAPTKDAVLAVTAALGQMAAFRGAPLDSATQELFRRRLLADGHQAEDIVAACGVLERRERAEGESAFPSLGTLTREIQQQASLRRTATATKALAASTDAEEPRFRCYQCLDAHWVELWCPEERCERSREHPPHAYAVRCVCWLRAHSETLVAQAQQALAQGKRPSILAAYAQAATAGEYPYQHHVTRYASRGATRRTA